MFSYAISNAMWRNPSLYYVVDEGVWERAVHLWRGRVYQDKAFDGDTHTVQELCELESDYSAERPT